MPKISKTTLLIAVIIAASSAFALQLSDFLKSLVGNKAFFIVFEYLILAAAFLAFIFIVRKRRSVIKAIASLAVLTVAVVFIRRMELPLEKIHIAEYAILGYLARRDFSGFFKIGLAASLSAFVFCIGVGCVDELFQLFLPYRVCDIRDVAMNGAGGLLGIFLHLLS